MLGWLSIFCFVSVSFSYLSGLVLREVSQCEENQNNEMQTEPTRNGFFVKLRNDYDATHREEKRRDKGFSPNYQQFVFLSFAL
jgi:hypothetical protein